MNEREVGGQMLAAVFVASAKKNHSEKEIKSNEQNRFCNVQLFSAFVMQQKEKEKKKYTYNQINKHILVYSFTRFIE